MFDEVISQSTARPPDCSSLATAMSLARRFSFGRRRDRTERPSLAKHIEVPRHDTPHTSSEHSDSPTSSEKNFESATSFTVLKGSLLKKHQGGSVVEKWGRRHFEVDDTLGVLYYYRNFQDAMFHKISLKLLYFLWFN